MSSANPQLAGTVIGGLLGAPQMGAIAGQGLQAVLGPRPPVREPAGPPAPAGRAAAVAAGAAAQLLQLLASPKLFQAVMAMLLDKAAKMGRQQVRIGGTPVPVAAVVNAAAALASRAAAEYNASVAWEGEATPRYLEGRVSDPANPEERAIAIMELVQLEPVAEAYAEEDEEDEWDEDEWDDEDAEFYDPNDPIDALLADSEID